MCFWVCVNVYVYLCESLLLVVGEGAIVVVLGLTLELGVHLTRGGVGAQGPSEQENVRLRPNVDTHRHTQRQGA